MTDILELAALRVSLDDALMASGYAQTSRWAIKHGRSLLAHIAAQDARIEALGGLWRLFFLHGHSSGWTGNQCRRDVKHDDAKKSWSFYVSDGGLSKTLAKAALGGEQHGG